MDLATNYMGLALRNPIVASASPLTGDIDMIRQIEDAGAAAIVLPSLFEEQIRRDAAMADALARAGADSSPEAGSYFPPHVPQNSGPQGYLELVSRARAAVAVPVIASLNGTSEAGWVDYARLIEQAGAHALELNIYRFASAPGVTGAAAEAACLGLVSAVRSRVKLPLAVKLHPHFSAFGDMAWQLVEAGASGLVLFNRVYQPDIDLARLKWDTELALSDPSEIRLGLLWISILSSRLGQASLAASTGVETSDEVIKYLLAGADVVMTAGALLRRGPRHLRHLIAGLETWLSRRGFGSVSAIRGLMRPSHPAAEIEARERGDYVTGLTAYRGPYVHH
jgi:dihydroorotate dehydrogenase (fumarate)